MKNKWIKRALTLVLSGALVVGYCMPALAEETTEGTTDTETVTGGDTITEDGTYYVASDATGTITVEATNVTIIGDSDATYSEFGITCTSADTTLTIEDLQVSNTTAVNAIDVNGTGNILYLKGTSVLDMNGGGCAVIHVGADDALTIADYPDDEETGVLYLYKSDMSAGIGGDRYEVNGDITFDSGIIFAKGSKIGATIGSGQSAEGDPGIITFNGGEYYLISNARGAIIGGAGGISGGTVYINGGTLNLNVNFAGAAIGDGGMVYFNGGSVRTFIDCNAMDSWGVEEYGVNDCAITAEKLNASDESVTLYTLDTTLFTADEDDFTVTVDGEAYYSGGLHSYSYVNEVYTQDEELDVEDTQSNWVSCDDTNLYIYLTGEDHEITVNGVTAEVTWDEESGTFTTEVSAVTGGDTITENGTYYLKSGATGTITVEATEATIVGDADATYSNLGISCTSEGTALTIEDLNISNDSAIYAIDVNGEGNTLYLKGTSVIDMNGSSTGYATIHVGPDDALTIADYPDDEDTGVLYLYKSEMAAGIGGDQYEANGDLTFDSGIIFAKGSKQGATIGTGQNAEGDAGTITFNGGEYYLIANARGALIGGGGGTDGGTVYINGGTLTLNVDWTGAAIGGGGGSSSNTADGGTVYITGGSVRTFIDYNAVSAWGVDEYGVNDCAITAEKLNASDESVTLYTLDTTLFSADEDDFTVTVDGEEYYSGGLHEYAFVNEDYDKDDQYPISDTPSNWLESSDTNLYIYLTEEDHEITVNGITASVTWDEESGTFTTEVSAVTGGDTITENGTYYLKSGATGTITVEATEATIVGDADATYSNLGISCTSAETTLTIEDLNISSDSAINAIDVNGEGNTLYLKGTSVLDMNGGGCAVIHVGPDDALTIADYPDDEETGVLYLYKSDMSAGIGGDRYEVNGDLTFDSGIIFAKGSKIGATIGSGQSAEGDPGTITFNDGEYYLISNARGAIIGGAGGISGGTVYINGGTLNLNVNFAGAAIGAGGTVYFNGGSVRTFIDCNAMESWGVEEYGVNDCAITAEKLNASGESVTLYTLDTTLFTADEDDFTVTVDGDAYYSGGLHSYTYVNEVYTQDEELDIEDTQSNWVSCDDTNLYIYLTEDNHTITVNGVTASVTWDEDSSTFTTEVSAVSGGDTITENGTYYLKSGATGTITVEATEATIVGDEDATYSNLGISCTSAETTLTIEDLQISNTTAVNAIDVNGEGNILYLKGTSVLDMNGGGCAVIHVGPEDALTIADYPDDEETGVLYLYKSDMSAGIGGDRYEVNGDLTFDSGIIFAKGSKIGATIGSGQSAEGDPGTITFNGGEYYLISNARGAIIGGAGGVDGGTVYINGGTLNLNVNFAGAAIGDGGTVYMNGGSVRTFIDCNAMDSWGVTEYGVNDVAITAEKLNASGESVTLYTLDTTLFSADEDDFTVTVDGDAYYSGGLHSYSYVNEIYTQDEELDIEDTQSNWVSCDDTNLYIYLTVGDHTITVNGVSAEVTWDEESGTFTTELSDTSDSDDNDDSDTGNDDSDSGSGDSGSTNGDSDTGSGDSDIGSGDSDSDTGTGDSDTGNDDSDSGSGDSGSTNGDSDTGSGDSDIGSGDSDSDTGTGDSDTGSGDSDSDTGSGDSDSDTGSGDSDSDSGSGDSDSGSGDSDSGDSGSGDSDSGSGDSDSNTGSGDSDSNTGSGDSDSGSGDSGSGSGDSDSDTGSGDSDTGSGDNGEIDDGSNDDTTTVAKKAQTIKIKNKSNKKTIKVKKLKNKKQTFKVKVSVKGNAKVTYTKLKKTNTKALKKGYKALKISKTGKVTIKKGTAKGTYKIKVKVKAKATAKYKARTKTITITVKVK